MRWPGSGWTETLPGLDLAPGLLRLVGRAQGGGDDLLQSRHLQLDPGVEEQAGLAHRTGLLGAEGEAFLGAPGQAERGVAGRGDQLQLDVADDAGLGAEALLED